MCQIWNDFCYIFFYIKSSQSGRGSVLDCVWNPEPQLLFTLTNSTDTVLFTQDQCNIRKTTFSFIFHLNTQIWTNQVIIMLPVTRTGLEPCSWIKQQQQSYLLASPVSKHWPFSLQDVYTAQEQGSVMVVVVVSHPDTIDPVGLVLLGPRGPCLPGL